MELFSNFFGHTFPFKPLKKIGIKKICRPLNLCFSTLRNFFVGLVQMLQIQWSKEEIFSGIAVWCGFVKAERQSLFTHLNTVASLFFFFSADLQRPQVCVTKSALLLFKTHPMVAKTSLIAFRGVGGRFNLKKNKTKQKNVATVPAVPPTL